MFAIGLIVFREALEAALFIGIMAAATKGIPQRSRWLWLGLVLGVLGSVALAFGMGYINDWAQGTGQDWMQILILGLAFLMAHRLVTKTWAGNGATGARAWTIRPVWSENLGGGSHCGLHDRHA